MTNPAFLLRPVVLAMCLSTAAVLAADPKPALADFNGMDTDHDGRVSAREHEAATQKMFRIMDANGDGRVTAGEMQAAQQKITGKKASATDMSAAEKIKALDIDGDGVLMAAEHAAGSQAIFERMDTNHDGYLDKAEWAAGHAALMKPPK